MSPRRNGQLDPIFERLMVKLVQDEPRLGYRSIDQMPTLSDDELAAVLDHVGECSPEDFRDFVNADLLSDWAQALRVTLFTPMVRHAALGEILKGRLQASARLWLVQYAAAECQAILDRTPDYDLEQIAIARAGGES